jgi:hypothetical protein
MILRGASGVVVVVVVVLECLCALLDPFLSGRVIALSAF